MQCSPAFLLRAFTCGFYDVAQCRNDFLYFPKFTLEAEMRIVLGKCPDGFMGQGARCNPERVIIHILFQNKLVLHYPCPTGSGNRPQCFRPFMCVNRCFRRVLSRKNQAIVNFVLCFYFIKTFSVISFTGQRPAMPGIRSTAFKLVRQKTGLVDIFRAAARSSLHKVW